MMTFEELLMAANGGKDRRPGQWTPAACKVWREAEPEYARLLEATWAWELAHDHRAQVRDEVAVRERRRAMDEVRAVKGKG
jgi:hypothetical protein